MAISGTQGTVSFIDDKPLLTGSFSGLNTAALIEASLFAKRQPAVTLERKITDNETKIAAYQELSGLAQTFESAVNALRNPPGFTGLTENFFEQKSIFLSSDTATTAAEILGATADNTAQPGIHQIVVEQIATAHKISSAAIADPVAALGITEDLTINLAGAAAENIETISITSTQSASDVVNAVNAVSSTTGVRASLVKVADADYRLIFTAEDTNKDIELSGTTGTLLSTLGVSADNGATYSDVLQTSQPALFTLDGIGTQIQRDNNEVDDVITGVTIDLFKADNTTTITLEIEADLSAIRAQFDTFVAAYNDVKLFIQSQEEVNGEGEVADTAILFADPLLRQLSNDIGNNLTSIVGTVAAGAFSNLRDIGIEFDSESLLTIDSAKLDAALVSDLDGVRGVLEFGFSSSSSRVSVIDRNATLDVGDFSITVPAGAINGLNLQVSGADAFEVDGNLLRGIEGTDYEGLVLAYTRDPDDAGEGAETINISTSLGIAERLFQDLEANTSISGGLITDEINRLQAQNSGYSDEIQDIDARLVIFQQSLIEKYAALEQALASADATANQLKAFLQASNNN